MLNEKEMSEILDRLKNHPEILESIKDLLDITEGIKGIEIADEAEFALIPEVRGLGKKCLQDWAKIQAKEKEESARTNRLKQHSKKKVTWHTTFGEVSTEERCYIVEGKLLRPFSKSSRVRCRGYSLPLEKALTDFGADVPFGKVVEKMKEHYGIGVPSSPVRLITEKHACKFENVEKIEAAKEEVLICETDGSMVPIVEIDPVKKEEIRDSRKARKSCWKEVKLSFAKGKDKIDFFHLCEYLSEAAVWCDIFDAKKWLEISKEKLKTGRHREVFEEIANKYSALENKDADNGLTRCYRYMEKRLDFMNYQQALARGLPIGSGEIESSHRHVVQKRLKIAGAWWKIENANAILNLRIGRLNGYWESYWNSQRMVA